MLRSSLVVALAACAGPSSPGAAPGARKLVITGSSTIAPLVSELGKRFEELHPGARVDVQSGGSQRGVTDAATGLADVGMASRSRKAEDPPELVFTPIANDGVAMIVHAENPVDELTRDEIVAIYTGAITRWSDVGGREAPITVVSKAEGRSTLELFCGHYDLTSPQIRASVVIGDNQQGIKTVAGNPDAIGYVSIGSAEHDAARGVPIRLLPLDGVAASTANVANGTFGLSRPLNLVTDGVPRGLAKEFVDFVLLPEQQDLVASQSFVPLAAL